MFNAVGLHFPECMPYLVAAYGATTNLYLGDLLIESEEGTQQGDPQSTLAFSATLAEAMASVQTNYHRW